MANRYLYLVRHGQYLPDHQPGEVQDGSLTGLGLEQCALLAGRLTGHKITRIYHSPLKRATETAAAIAREFPSVVMEPDALLVECVPGVPPDDMLEPHQKEFFTALPANAIEEGSLQARQAFEKYFCPFEGEEDTHEIIVSHGNLISYFISQMFLAAPHTWLKTDIMNGGLSEIIIKKSGHLRLVSHNDTGHLPHNKKSWV
jgi:serine/threonine-protein phosphatase PGAM5